MHAPQCPDPVCPDPVRPVVSVSTQPAASGEVMTPRPYTVPPTTLRARLCTAPDYAQRPTEHRRPSLPLYLPDTHSLVGVFLVVRLTKLVQKPSSRLCIHRAGTSIQRFKAYSQMSARGRDRPGIPRHTNLGRTGPPIIGATMSGFGWGRGSSIRAPVHKRGRCACGVGRAGHRSTVST